MTPRTALSRPILSVRSVVAADAPHESATADERLYLRARLALCGLLAVLPFLGLRYPSGPGEVYLYASMLAILICGTVYMTLIWSRGSRAVKRAMIWMLVPDLISLTGFTYLYSELNDAFYPVVILLPVAYALIMTKPQAWIAAGAAAIAFIAGHVLAGAFGIAEFSLSTLKAIAVVLIASMVASSVAKQRSREAEAARAVTDKDQVNVQLNRRISELQAVSEITEIVHSTLDFNQVGGDVLEILGRVVGIEACCLFVIDKEKSETLFSASLGETGGDASYAAAAPGCPPVDSHFSCIPVFDHAQAMVLFCASSEDIERLSEDDRLVLSAVASELVVGVENSRLYSLTKRLAITDELTGLYNYRYLQSRLDQELDRARRYCNRLSLLMIDADDFKNFNDSHGHVAGDEALGDLAEVLQAEVREVDMVARYGGEEFSMLLPETDAAGAFVVAEKVREAMAAHLFRDADGVRCCHLTVSIGLATFPTHAWDKDSLLREADDALYRAKDGGRNRVRAPKHQKRAEQPVAGVADERTGD